MKTLAFKEWAYIVDALGQGKQSIIIRKGGISEEGGDFSIRGKKFLLFPTLFHQAQDMIKTSWINSLSAEKYFPSPDKVRIDFFAEIVDSKIIKDWNTLAKLDSQHAWKEDIIQERFSRWEKSAHLLIVQVFKLNIPFELELLPEHGGCKSWLELDNIPELNGSLIPNIFIKGSF